MLGFIRTDPPGCKQKADGFPGVSNVSVTFFELEESYGHVGDTGETISLLLASRGICPNESQHSVSLSS